MVLALTYRVHTIHKPKHVHYNKLTCSARFKFCSPVMKYNISIIYMIQADLLKHHYGDVIMSTIASQITSLTVVYSTVYSDADQRKHQSSASLAFVRGIHRRPVSSPHKWPVTRKMFPFDDVIMTEQITSQKPLYLCTDSRVNKRGPWAITNTIQPIRYGCAVI